MGSPLGSVCYGKSRGEEPKKKPLKEPGERAVERQGIAMAVTPTKERSAASAASGTLVESRPF